MELELQLTAVGLKPTAEGLVPSEKKRPSTSGDVLLCMVFFLALM